MRNEQLDEILNLQLAVAFAGEANTDPPRLGWWRTGMCDEFGGEDLLNRLAPKTWKWAALESARAAAKRVDDRIRQTADDPDQLLTLYHLGFEVDEQLDERLLELKQSGAVLSEAFPEIAGLASSWSSEKFSQWLGDHGKSGESDFSATATGRRLKGDRPDDLGEAARCLAAALHPLDNAYPLPHYRLGR